MSRNFELLNSLKKKGYITPSNRDFISPNEAISPRFTRSETEERFDWWHVIKVLQRHWRWSAGFALIVFTSVWVLTARMKPVYEPRARIEVNPPGAETFSLHNAGPSYDASEYIETQAQKLRSDELAVQLIQKFGLDRASQFGQHPVHTEPGTTEPAPSETPALRAFRANLKVSRDSSSHLITVSYAAHDPKLAAEVTNALVNLFIDDSYRTRHAAIGKSSDWLSKQLEDVHRKMEESNRALASFQASTGIASDANGTTFTERMAELNRQLAQAQSERIQHEAMLHRLKSGSGMDSPQVSSDPVVQELRKKLSEARAQLSQALVVYGRRNPNVTKIQDGINELEQQLTVQRERIAQDAKTGYMAAETRERLLKDQIKTSSKDLNKLAQYEALKKEAQATSELYNTLFEKVKEAGIAAESTSANIRFIDPARVLTRPTRPNLLLNLLAGLGAGMLGGIALAFVRDALDTTVYTSEDLKTCTGLSAITIVPRIGAQNKLGKLLPARNNGAHELLVGQPFSPESEAILGLYTSLQLGNPDRPPQVVLIASPSVGEGKTTLAINLALALARHGRTLLIDADLRKAALASALGISTRWGLRDILAGNADLEHAFAPHPESTSLVVLTAGNDPAIQPGELLYSAEAADILRTARHMFDHVVIDSPPILPFADARALARLADGVVLVGRAGTTTKENLARSVELLQMAHAAPVLEVVLNDASTSISEYRHYDRYYQSTRTAS